MPSHDNAFPPIALHLATELDIAPAACLLAGGINFYYRRGPHLSPPHQIAGLARSFVPRVLNHFEIPFRRYVAKDGDTISGALTATSLPAVAEMNDSILWIQWSDTGDLHIDAAGRQRTLSQETFAAEWYDAVPTGTLYVVDWNAVTEVDAVTADVLRTAVLENAYDMMICSGAWQGIDGIEYFSEDVVRWYTDEKWPNSAITAAQQIRAGGSLWRHAYGAAMRDFQETLTISDKQCQMLDGMVELWSHIADLLDETAGHEDAGRLATVSQRLLRIVSAESRFWNYFIRQSEPGI